MYLFFAFSYIPALWGGLGLFQACKDFFLKLLKDYLMTISVHNIYIPLLLGHLAAGVSGQLAVTQ